MSSDTPRLDDWLAQHAKWKRTGCEGDRPLPHRLEMLAAEFERALNAPRSETQDRVSVLLGVIEMVRQHPDFDQGGPMAEMMDQALKGETPNLLVAAHYLRQGRRPPE